MEQLLHEVLAVREPVLVTSVEASLHHASAQDANPWPWSVAAPTPDPAASARWQAWVPESLGDSDIRAGDALASPPDTASWAPPGVTQDRRPEGARAVSRSSDPGAEIAALTAALDAVAAQDPASLPGPLALARTRALLQAGERVKALSLEALADVETRSLHALDDSPTVHAWVAGLGVPGVDGREVTLSRRLRRVPLIRQELQAGRMSSRTAAVLTTAVAKARPFLDRPDGLVDGLDGEQALEGVLVRGVCSLVAEQIGGAADADRRLDALRQELVALNDPDHPRSCPAGRLRSSCWHARATRHC